MGKVGISYTNRAPPLGEYQATSSLLPASLPFLICSIVSQIVSTLVTVIQMNLKGAFSVSGTIGAREAVIKGKVPVQEEASLAAQMVNNLLLYRRPRFDPWVGKIPWRREWQPIPVFLLGGSIGQRSLAGYSAQGCKSQIRPSD